MSAKPTITAATVSRSGKPRSARFARIDNAALQCAALSFRARGVLAYVLSMPDGWRHSAASLSHASTDGVDAIRAALRELNAAGFATLSKVHDDRGRVENRWSFRESPSAEKADTVTPAPCREKADTVNTPPSRPLPGPGQPPSGQPPSGEPPSGEPGPGKCPLFLTTINETTINETTIEKLSTGAAPAGEWDAPFDLTGTTAETPAPASTPPPVAPAPASRHAQICQQWGALYHEAWGRTYAFNGRDAKSLQRLLLLIPDTTDAILDVAKAAWKRGGSQCFAVQCRKAGTIHGLCANWNEINVELASPEGPPDKTRAGWADTTDEFGSVRSRKF